MKQNKETYEKMGKEIYQESLQKEIDGENKEKIQLDRKVAKILIEHPEIMEKLS